jgi:putative addiction module component (TIGR02574 family)
MTATLKKKANELVAALTPKERMDLAEALIISVPDFATPEIEAAWNKEIDRRLDEYEAGRAVVHTEEEVHARVRKAIDEARRSTRRRHA